MQVFEIFNNTLKQSWEMGETALLKLQQLFVEAKGIKKKKDHFRKRKFKKQNTLEANDPINSIK